MGGCCGAPTGIDGSEAIDAGRTETRRTGVTCGLRTALRADREVTRVAGVVAVYAAASLTAGCNATDAEYPKVAQVESRVLVERGQVTVRNGGYGSAAAAVPGRPGFFYLL